MSSYSPAIQTKNEQMRETDALKYLKRRKWAQHDTRNRKATQIFKFIPSSSRVFFERFSSSLLVLSLYLSLFCSRPLYPSPLLSRSWSFSFSPSLTFLWSTAAAICDKNKLMQKMVCAHLTLTWTIWSNPNVRWVWIYRSRACYTFAQQKK